MPQLSLHTPIMDITITEFDEKIVSLDWGWSPFQEPTPFLKEAKKQLDAYFDGDLLNNFDLPLDLDGSKHQKNVWQAMLEIPFGETITYGELAKKIGSAAQPVGTACGTNPIPIIVPCHRVLASGNKMGGFSGEGGVHTKRALLILEGAMEYKEEIQKEQLNLLD
jgi:methylated-DNA-[protein]-cysteine S-methyltransferase